MSPRLLHSILVRRTDRFSTTAPLDIGFLCETMLFYQHSVLLADLVIIRQLIRVLGIDTLLALLGTGMLTVHYSPKQMGLMSGGIQKVNTYTAMRVSLAKDIHDVFQEEIAKQIPQLGRSRRLARRLVNSIKVVDLSTSVETAFRQGIQDRGFLKRSFQAWLQAHLETEGKFEFDFDLTVTGEEIQFRSNLDYSQLSPAFRNKVGPDHSLTDALLLSQLQDVYSNIYLAAEYEAEIASDPRNQVLDRMAINQTVTKLHQSQAEIERFHETVFPDSRDVRAAINSGGRSVDDFIVVLEKAHQFRSWLKERPNDVPLVADYFKAATEQTWVDKLPTKIARWAVFTGLGHAISPAGFVAGAALSAIDAFYLDRFMKKWTPNQFIEGEYKKFIDEN
jgi:hypothetical protein